MVWGEEVGRGGNGGRSTGMDWFNALCWYTIEQTKWII